MTDDNINAKNQGREIEEDKVSTQSNEINTDGRSVQEAGEQDEDTKNALVTVKDGGGQALQKSGTDVAPLGGEEGAIPVYHGDSTGLSTYVAGEGQSEAQGERKGRIGEQLVAMGLITEDQLNVAIQEKKFSGKMLGAILVELGFIDEETLTSFLAESSGHEVFDPKATIFDGQALETLPKEEAIKHQILPVSISDEELVVATADPYNVVALDRIRRYFQKGISIKPLVTTPSVLADSIDAAFGYASSIENILKELEDEEAIIDVTKLTEEDAFTHPIVRLVNTLLFDAVKMGASDLHFEPEENFLRLRYRVDGVLFTAHILHRQHWQGISQRIKIMSGMNIADKLSPQDGRFPLNIGGREADFRVNSLPTVHGENIVMRVLDKSESILPLEILGFSPENLEKIKISQSKPEGIIIVTGPTGSGKTTSLYSMLNEINDVEVNIQTLEDPVEYSLPMIRQTHVREGVLDFGDGIKALLRQDPDIIFIGEVRDKTTAEMALKAAMTGHQVYTTLHTNDSFGAIPRVLDFGLKPGMIAGAIVSVFAQRLGRRLCSNCKEEHIPNEYECTELLDADPSDPPKIYKAKQGGCPACKGVGYKGRVAICEILLFDDDMNELLAANATKAELRKTAFEKGFKDMRYDAILKIKDGITSIEAASKVISLKK